VKTMNHIQEIQLKLRQLIKIHLNLFEVQTTKKEAIIKNKMDVIKSTMKDELEHTRYIRKIQAEMLSVCRAYLTEQNIVVEEPITLEQVIQVVSEEEKEQLLSLKDGLVGAVDSLKMLVYQNQELLKQSIEYINLTMDLLAPDLEIYNYGSESPIDQSKEVRSSFDSKA